MPRPSIDYMNARHGISRGKIRSDRLRNPVDDRAAWESLDSWEQEMTAVTACPQGHPYTAENTRFYDGERQCRACHRAHCRDYERRKRAAGFVRNRKTRKWELRP